MWPISTASTLYWFQTLLWENCRTKKLVGWPQANNWFAMHAAASVWCLLQLQNYTGSNQSKESTTSSDTCNERGRRCTSDLLTTYFKGVKYSKSIKVTDLQTVWRAWGDFHGKFEYYTFKTKGSSSAYPSIHHKGLCVRHTDTGATVQVDLIVDSPTTWCVSIRPTTWRPDRVTVHESEHRWHPAMHMFT